jgi:hypothetical protein
VSIGCQRYPVTQLDGDLVLAERHDGPLHREELTRAGDALAEPVRPLRSDQDRIVLADPGVEPAPRAFEGDALPVLLAEAQLAQGDPFLLEGRRGFLGEVEEALALGMLLGLELAMEPDPIGEERRWSVAEETTQWFPVRFSRLRTDSARTGDTRLTGRHFTEQVELTDDLRQAPVLGSSMEPVAIVAGEETAGDAIEDVAGLGDEIDEALVPAGEIQAELSYQRMLLERHGGEPFFIHQFHHGIDGREPDALQDFAVGQGLQAARYALAGERVALGVERARLDLGDPEWRGSWVEGNLDAVSAAGEPSRGGVEEPLEVELERFGSRIECPLDLIEDGVRCLEREAQILGRKTVFRLLGGEQRLDRARPLGPDGGSVLGSGQLAVTGGGEGHQRATVASVDGATADVARLRLALAEVARQAEEALEEHLERAPIELLDQAARHRVLRCDDELEEDDLSPAARVDGGDRSEHLQAERCRDAASGTCLEDMREHREVVRERVGVWTARVPLIGVDSAVAQGTIVLGGRVQDELAPLVAAGSWFD